jgi:heme A synthase
VTLARRILLSAWSGYALLWLVIAVIAYVPGEPREPGLGEAMVVVLGFVLAQIAMFFALLIGIMLGWRAFRQSENRTWPNFALVGVSILGALGQAFYAGRLVGVL